MKNQFLKKIVLLGMLMPLSIYVHAQSSNQNYVQTRTPMVAVTDPATLSSLPYTQQQTTIQYYDGLGRPLQTVQKQATTNAKDIVQPFEYDALGREVKKYLPYSNITGSQDGGYKTNALTAGQGVWAHYKLATQSIDTTSFPFAETILEASPLNRMTEQGAPGKAFRVLKDATGKTTSLGNTIKTEYSTNTATEVKLWKLTANGATGTTNYNAGQLYKTISKDENWKATDLQHGTVEEFKDKAGRVVLKRTFNKNQQGATETLSTYYVYDDFGNLRYVIPPAVSATSFSESVTDNVFNNFIYAYRYDNRQRVIQKKIPGAWWVHLVYNRINQLVFTQDSVQRKNKEWLFTKYDAMGRVILTGIYTDTARRSTLQAKVNAQTANLWEGQGSAHYGYTKGALPTTAMKVLVANYYDDYSFAMPTGYTYVADSLNTQSLMTRGLLTASMVKVLNSNDSLWTVNYYDSKGQVVQVHRQNYIGGKDLVNTRYSFTGLPLVVKRIHTNSKGTGTQTFLTWYTYDHMGRKTRTREKIINGTVNASGQPVVLADYVYNELGQLITKKLHQASGASTYAQTVDYQYNIRGWLKKINDPAAVTGVLTGTADKFGMELKYDNGPVPQFNGNISDIIWKGSYRDTLQEYSFGYDKLNRLLKAQSMQGGLSNNYQERIDEYDLMGNIKKLSRRSRNVLIDSLVYSYKNSNNSNQLDQVDEFSNAATIYKNLGFSEPVSMQQAGEYTYDVNGNLSTDKNGLITAISYNYLNLPQSITKNGTTVNYVYDATGRKLRKTVGTTSEEYVDGLQLQTFNGTTTINFIATEEGRASWNGASNPYYYRYNLTDHLGNVRATVNESGTSEQEDSYYAFGLQMPGKSYTPSGDNKYLYNGKELQKELGWYDYGARFFDPTLGRWHVLDPLAEMSSGFSPYVYGNNNPVLMIDPDGMMSRYNWATNQYYDDKDGDGKQGKKEKNVEWDQVQQEYSLGGSGGDDPKKKGEKSAASNVASGFGDGALGTWEGIKSQFTLNGYLNGLANTFTFGTHGSIQLGEKVFDLASNIPNYTAADYEYGAGYAFEKVVELYLFKKLGNAIAKTSTPLYHYTSEAGYNAIMDTKVLNPSIGLKNARFGSGQYFTDIAPGMFTKGQTSYRLFGVPWNGSRLTHFIKIETSGLNIIQNKPFNFLNPSPTPLNLKGRILGGGKTGF